MRPHQLEEIPSGYQLQVTTWENDGDDYTTQTISGLTKEDVRFYIELALRFENGSNNNMETLGNYGHHKSYLMSEVQEMLIKHPNVSEGIKVLFSEVQEFHEDDDCLPNDTYNTLCKTILGYPVSEYYRYEEENFCRVFERFQVFYIPEVAKEVTHMFK